MKFIASLAALSLAFSLSQARADFTLQDTPGQHMDVLQDGKIVGRYMYAYDKSSKERLAETYKPYLHVFDAEGKAPITKGPGGQFTHHRGIFIGWNKIAYNGKTYDRWHMSGGEQVHQKFLKQEADANGATITSQVNWNDEKGQPFIVEERTMSFRKAPTPAYVLIDFASKISPIGDVELNGDPEHAGIHFRPAQEVDPKQTSYLYPIEGAKPHADKDYPWVGETFSLNGNKYSVLHINHPGNPKETRYSAYRDYGRFGAFPVAKIKGGESQTFQYRFAIAQGEMFSAETIQTIANSFTGENQPTPKTTSTLSEQPKPAAK
ncbi:MAG TPA: DUF6807 family protein [Abditibacteriaceae bacterium]|jgi:hypothetical protein